MKAEFKRLVCIFHTVPSGGLRRTYDQQPARNAVGAGESRSALAAKLAGFDAPVRIEPTILGALVPRFAFFTGRHAGLLGRNASLLAVGCWIGMSGSASHTQEGQQGHTADTTELPNEHSIFLRSCAL